MSEQRIRIPSERGVSTVVVGAGILAGLDRLVAEVGMPSLRAVVSNTTVGPLYARQVAAGLDVAVVELEDGERFKVWSAVERCCGSWLEARLSRGDAVLAVGGGVVTDTAGFAASVYMRGIAWGAVPTSLLAMVDASVGGKTGVNLAEGKNLVGTFWPPALVVADVATLETLDERQLRSGLVEVVKAAWIGDRDLLDLVDPPPRRLGEWAPERWTELVARAVRFKAAVVARDEREHGWRRVLNLGHTLGHGLEAATGYERVSHGEAVAWGMIAAGRIARRRGLLGPRPLDRLETCLRGLGPLPRLGGIDPQEVVAHVERDKKRDVAGIGWVLPTDDGVVLDQRVDPGEVADVLDEIGRG